MITIETIEEVVCKVRGIDPDDLHRRTRRREICETRQIVMYFAVLDKHTQAFTSRYFGLEHCSAIHARKNVERLVSVDKAIRLDVAIIRKRLSEDENEQLAYLSSIEKSSMKAEDYIKEKWGEGWLDAEWEAGDVLDAIEGYAEKENQELNIELSFAYGKIDKYKELVEAMEEYRDLKIDGLRTTLREHLDKVKTLREKIEQLKSEL